MTGAAKTLLAIIALLVICNLFLLFEVNKINGSLTDLRTTVGQLKKTTNQNQKLINDMQSGALYNYMGGN